MTARQRRARAMGLLIVGAVVLSGCGTTGATNSRIIDNRTDVASDVLDIWKEVAYHYVDFTEAPSVTYSEGIYTVERTTLEARAKNPELVFEANGPEDWCVTIHYNNRSAAASMGSDFELQDQAGC